jgi:hypothetical protein
MQCQEGTLPPPGGNFAIPATSSSPLLAFRCAPAIKPYLAEDAFSSAAFIIDAPVVFSEIVGAEPIAVSSRSKNLDVTIKVGSKTVAFGEVPLNASKHELTFSLFSLSTQSTPFDVSCSATYEGKTYTDSTQLLFLPDPAPGTGSVTKMDLRTGGLLAKPADGSEGPYETVFPIGFYTSFDGYLATNLSTINLLKEQGFTVIHPVPTFDNMTALHLVIERMQEVGMYLMYDMRL